jgi:3-methylcrotonyl-CoA carboxylase alpha subunit
MTARELHWRVGDQEITCRIEESKGNGTFHFSGNTVPFRLLDSTHIEISGTRHRFYVIHNRDSSTVWLDGRTYYLQHAKKSTGTETKTGTGTGEVRALMPGKLLRLTASAGDTVTEKQIVAIMESMKMESALFAPITGRVVEVRFKPGDVVEMGDIVIVIEGNHGVRPLGT